MPPNSTLRPHVGIDFGTSNSVVAVADAGGVRLARFEVLGAPTEGWRSLLFFDPEEQDARHPIQVYAGGDAVEAYLERLGEGRLVQSFKSHLTSGSLGRTQIGPHMIGLEDMIALFLSRFRKRAEAQLGIDLRHATFGRPVRFVGGRTTDDDTAAERRLDAAARLAGFAEVTFELEPVAAAYHYARSLTRPELALVADFGGGTTDVCVMRVGPSEPSGESVRDILATGGVAAAGDDLDAALIEHVIAPHLGKGDTYVEMGQERSIPSSYYFKLARWHHLSFLAGPRTRAELERLERCARHPDRIAALRLLIEDNQGFHLHKAVERLKIALSNEPSGVLDYAYGPIHIRQQVTRESFERWIEPITRAIATCLDETLERANLRASDIDHVFMAGGTAFVPAVRRIFEQRFGTDKLRGGDEMISIASGLALSRRHGEDSH